MSEKPRDPMERTKSSHITQSAQQEPAIEIPIGQALPQELLNTALFSGKQDSPVEQLQEYKIILLDGGFGFKHKQTGATFYPIRSADRIVVTETTLEQLQSNLAKLGQPQLEIEDRRRSKNPNRIE